MLLKIEGMGCMHCVAKVKKAMEALGAEVKSCEIGSCEIEGIDNIEQIRGAIESAGFELISAE
jgi:copper chaperone CopZ